MRMLAFPLLLAQADDAADEDSTADDAMEQALENPPENLSEALSTIQASLWEMWNDFLLRLPLLVAGLALLVLTWIVASVVNAVAYKSLKRTRLRASLQDLFRQIIYLMVWIVGLLAAAVVVFPGMTPAKVLTVLGLGSIAIGFAFKDIVENFFAGVLILWRFPFEPGDFIECGEIRGKVESTTIRMTTVRQVDGQLVALPNAKLFKEPVNVVTSMPKRRITVICGVDYDTDLDLAKQTFTKTLEECDSVDQSRRREVFAQEFGGSSINFEVTWWTGSTPFEVRQSRDEVVRAIKRDLDAAGISIPFPHRTLTFKEPLEHAQAAGRGGQADESAEA